MILDLNPYQLETPYPKIDRIMPEPDLAAQIMDGYSGEYSELTTLLQYAHHSLRCQARYHEISKTMRGIFYVETLHMEFLGGCLCKLGGNIEYKIELQDHSIYWQAAIINYENSPAQMLLADLEGEKGAAAFYEELAQKTRQANVADLMNRLAADERLHIQILTELYHKYFR